MAKAARLIERLWAAAYAILKSGASQFLLAGLIHPSSDVGPVDFRNFGRSRRLA